MVGTTLVALAALLGVDTSQATNTGKASTTADKLTAKQVGADITGYYSCRGTDGKGGSYSGVAVISKQREVYVVQWTIGVGSAFVGLGIRQGESLSVSWAMAGDKGSVVRGINVYRIEAGPRLTGQWATLPGNGTINTETLTLLKRLEAE
jgi:hypothetical protein